MSGIVIEQATTTDCEQLTQLAFSSKASNGYDDAFMAQCREELAVTPDTMAIGETWKAVGEENQLLGFFGIRMQGRTAEVHGLYVTPASKRSGVGSVLWAKLEHRAGELGADKLELDSDPAAVAFYEAKGMAICGQSPSGSIPGRMLPRMAKLLA